MDANENELSDFARQALEAAENVNRMVYAITVPPMWLFATVMIGAPAGLMLLLWMLYVR